MRSSTRLLLLTGILALCSGCASLGSNVPFQYQPALIASGKQIPKTVGFEMLVDARPEKDKKYTAHIHDIPGKITSKVIDDFNTSHLFSDVHYPVKETDDIMVGGTIKRFKWKFYDKLFAYIPYVGLALVVLGVPLSEAYGITELQLEFKERASGKILGTFSAESKVTSSYSIYNFKAGESGSELAESFRDVVRKLKEEIALKLSGKPEPS